MTTHTTASPIYPASILTDIGDVNFDLDAPAGTLTLIGLAGTSAPLVISERDIYALAAFFRAPLAMQVVDAMEAARQDAAYYAYRAAAAEEDARMGRTR